MGRHTSPTEQQGYYRYDPTGLEQKGPARIFPYSGEDGVLRYILTKLRQNLLDQGKLSQPWSLLLQQTETAIQTVEKGWAQLSTLLVDWTIFQSGWLNFDLPPDEQFDVPYVQARREMASVLLAARKAVQSFQSNPASEVPDSIQQRRSRFYQALEAKQRSRPAISQIHERDGGLSDREFARQRVAGQNPMVLRRVLPADQPLLQPWLGQAQRLNDGHSVELIEAADEHRLFLADYPILQNLTPGDLQTGRYVGSPIALFYRSDAGLEPVLIQVEPGRIVAPADADDWMRAKLYVQTADVTHHELIAHLCNTHLAMEAFAIATPRQLPANHPVYRLLHPHFKFLLAINTRGNVVLLGEGAAIDDLMAPTRAASIGLINQSYRQHAFQSYALPVDLEQRGLEPEFLPEFPYRDDAQLLWTAINRYVTRYLQRYYPDDRAVQRDVYLQAWAAELGAPLESRPGTDFPQAPGWLPRDVIAQTGLAPEVLPQFARVPDFPNRQEPGRLTSLQQLIDIATQVIFTCGPQHAAVNFSQFDYVGYVPNAPLALYRAPDSADSLETLLPSKEQDLDQMELTFALSGIHWGQFGQFDADAFLDAGDRQAVAAFQAELSTIEHTIQARNQQRLADSSVDYPYLLPSRIPNSINI